MIDEADKAPINVTCVLKTLVENGEMVLGDGRRVVPGSIKNKITDYDPITALPKAFGNDLLSNDKLCLVRSHFKTIYDERGVG